MSRDRQEVKGEWRGRGGRMDVRERKWRWK